jgi:hypothetical protein
MSRKILVLVFVVSTSAPVAGALSVYAQSPVEGFGIISQIWHPQEEHRGLAVAEITFENKNPFSIYEPTIACEFFKPSGELIGSRGTHIHMVFPPGTTEIKGIEFAVGDKDALPGSCRVVAVLTSPSPD